MNTIEHKKALKIRWTFNKGIRLSFVLVFFALASLAIGGENEAIRELVRLVGVDEVDQWNEAPKFFASIADDSKLKPVASQAIAILEIRQGNYSKAWKILASQSNILEAAPVSLRSGHEKLRLWLLMEAESKDAAESQFKRLVAIAIHKDLPDAERKDLGSFLGGVVGMLESAGTSSPIAKSTVAQGKVAFETIESKFAVEQFRLSLQATEEWNRELQARLKEFTTVAAGDSVAIITSLQDKRSLNAKVLEEVTEKIHEDAKSKKILDDELKKMRVGVHSIEVAWNTVTTGMPWVPREPRYSGHSKKYEDLTTFTGEKKKIETAESKKESDKMYSKYQHDMKRYQDDLLSYPARLEEWKQFDVERRKKLQENKKIADQLVVAKRQDIDAILESIQSKVATSKEARKTVEGIERSIAIAEIAIRSETPVAAKSKSLARPSNFQLLDFKSEFLRLEKSRREVSR